MVTNATALAALKIAFTGFFFRVGEKLADFAIRAVVAVFVLAFKLVAAYVLFEFFMGFK